MKYIAIRKEQNGSLYMDKNFFNRFTDADLGVYRFIKVAVPDKYFDKLSVTDFDDNLSFIEGKYLARIQREADLEKLPDLKAELNSLSQDIVQAQAGAIIPDYEKRLTRFKWVHNEIRRIELKEPREYKED